MVRGDGLDRIASTIKLGTSLYVCEDESCQAIVQAKHCIWAEIMGTQDQIFCSMKCAYALAKDFDGLIALFDPIPGRFSWVALGCRRAMSERFALTAAGLQRLEQEENQR